MKGKKTIHHFLGALFVMGLVSCTKSQPKPLPTLAPVAQVPEVSSNNIQDNESSETASSSMETPTVDSNINQIETNETIINSKGSLTFFNNAGEGLFFINPSWSDPIRPYNLQNISRFFTKSPNGDWLVLVAGGKLYFAKTDGSAINEISGFENISRVTWSPNGKQVAFIQDGNIFTLEVDGGEPHRLTNELDLNDSSTSISYSPDGSKLIFACNSSAIDICVISIQENGSLVNLTNNTGMAVYLETQWSPNGDLISFVSPDQEDRLQLFIMNTDGSNLVQLTNSGENNLHAWSPDGSRIVYTNVEDNKWRAIVMNRDGSEKLLVSENLPPEVNSILPSWSPNGNLIGLFFTLPSNPDEFSISIWGMEDSQSTILTNQARWADWSPDSTQIAFVTPDSQIQIVNADGTGDKKLINCPDGCEFFTWLP